MRRRCKMKLALNKTSKKMKNKVYPVDMAQYTYCFRNFSLEPREFYAEVAIDGYPFCIAELIEDEHDFCHKKTENFVSCSVIAVDIDNTDLDKYWSYEEAVNDPFVIKNALFIYTTPSHTEEHNRFRIVFLLPETVTDKEKVIRLNKALSFKFSGDIALTSCVQSYFGSTNRKSIFFGNTFDTVDLEEMVRGFEGGAK